MSDEQRRTNFARRVTAVELEVFSRTPRWDPVAKDQFYGGPRFNRKKVKRERKLSHVLLRSAFGRSED
jgi:hypothetical protein